MSEIKATPKAPRSKHSATRCSVIPPKARTGKRTA